MEILKDLVVDDLKDKLMEWSAGGVEGQLGGVWILVAITVCTSEDALSCKIHLSISTTVRIAGDNKVNKYGLNAF